MTNIASLILINQEKSVILYIFILLYPEVTIIADSHKWTE